MERMREAGVPQGRDWRAVVLAQVAFYAGLGVIIPGGMVAGYLLGNFLDEHLHTAPFLGMMGGLLGTAGGIIEVIQIVTRKEKNGPDSLDSNSRG
jgi:F0F1-type ATP synthase assembly protein I